MQKKPLLFVSVVLGTFVLLAFAVTLRRSADSGVLLGQAGSACGNRVVDSGEQCDDGNRVNGDGCSANCEIDGSNCRSPLCGNRVLDADEACDDGNGNDGDGCSMFCDVEEAFHCTGTPSVCTLNPAEMGWMLLQGSVDANPIGHYGSTPPEASVGSVFRVRGVRCPWEINVFHECLSAQNPPKHQSDIIRIRNPRRELKQLVSQDGWCTGGNVNFSFDKGSPNNSNAAYGFMGVNGQVGVLYRTYGAGVAYELSSPDSSGNSQLGATFPLPTSPGGLPTDVNHFFPFKGKMWGTSYKSLFSVPPNGVSQSENSLPYGLSNIPAGSAVYDGKVWLSESGYGQPPGFLVSSNMKNWELKSMPSPMTEVVSMVPFGGKLWVFGKKESQDNDGRCPSGQFITMAFTTTDGVSWERVSKADRCFQYGGTDEGARIVCHERRLWYFTHTQVYTLAGIDGACDDSEQGSSSSTGPTCGNGRLDGNEQCDDGNTISQDGCSATCTVEYGWDCQLDLNQKSVCTSCPNGYYCSRARDQYGTCITNGGCIESETLNISCGDGTCMGQCTRCSGFCGDGRVQRDIGEECDDGNNVSGDGCTSHCFLEYSYSSSSRSLSGTCGNGDLDPGEDCDWGVAFYVNPCPGNEQCDLATCLCPSHMYSSASSECVGEKGVFVCTLSLCGDGLCGKDENMSNCPNDCNVSFRYASWQCHNGEESQNGGTTFCKDRRTWESYASNACKNKCTTTYPRKCGVNGFTVWEKCGLSMTSAASSSSSHIFSSFSSSPLSLSSSVASSSAFSSTAILSSSTSSVVPLCGNSRLEAGEQCERGIACPSGFACDVSTCWCSPVSVSSAPLEVVSSLPLAPQCGDGIMDLGEQCERGMPCPSGFYCSDHCQCLPISAFASSSLYPSASTPIPIEEVVMMVSSASSSPPLFSSVAMEVPSSVIPPGGDRDIHGCIGSAGYTWCELRQKCLRTWEEPCSTLSSAVAVSSAPVCAGENETVYGSTAFGPTACCSQNAGVKLNSVLQGNTCSTPSDGSLGTCVEGWWMTCGDGSCDKGEDRCNCPKDCSSTCGNGLLDPGEQCERGIDCPQPKCTVAPCPRQVCDSTICACSLVVPSPVSSVGLSSAQFPFVSSAEMSSSQVSSTAPVLPALPQPSFFQRILHFFRGLF